MADHARGVAFLIMDGVLPGNEGRGYVLRRIIRRAVQQGVSIGLDRPFLAKLCRSASSSAWATPTRSSWRRGPTSPWSPRKRRCASGARWIRGMGILEEALRRARDSGAELPPEVAFQLHDTYGFPFDLTREIAAERTA